MRKEFLNVTNSVPGTFLRVNSMLSISVLGGTSYFHEIVVSEVDRNTREWSILTCFLALLTVTTQYVLIGTRLGL